MNQEYFDGTDKIEKMGIDNEYLLGWQGGYLGNPSREEQRITDAYTAGYEDGQNKSFDKAAGFKK